MGLLSSQDASIFRSYFKEMAKLQGIPVKYQYPIDMSFSQYAEENPTGFSEPEDMCIIFNANPKISTLRKYGWVVEANDDKPFIATLPYDAPQLQKGCRIILPVIGGISSERIFVITELYCNLDTADSWVCKLAPVLHNKPDANTVQKTSLSGKNNNFLNVPK